MYSLNEIKSNIQQVFNSSLLTLHEQLEPQKQFVKSENWSSRKLVWSEMITETKTSYCFYTKNTNFFIRAINPWGGGNSKQDPVRFLFQRSRVRFPQKP